MSTHGLQILLAPKRNMPSLFFSKHAPLSMLSQKHKRERKTLAIHEKSINAESFRAFTIICKLTVNGLARKSENH